MIFLNCGRFYWVSVIMALLSIYYLRTRIKLSILLCHSLTEIWYFFILCLPHSKKSINELNSFDANKPNTNTINLKDRTGKHNGCKKKILCILLDKDNIIHHLKGSIYAILAIFFCIFFI